MSLAGQSGMPGIESAVGNLRAGVTPALEDFTKFAINNNQIFLILGVVGLAISGMIGSKHGKAGEVGFVLSGITAAIGAIGYFSTKSPLIGSAYAHSYYAPGMPQGPYYMPYMYNSPPQYPIYQGPPNVHYVYPQHHPSLFEMIFGKKKHKKKKHHHPFYPLYAQPLNSFYTQDADVIVPRDIVTGRAQNTTRNTIDDSNHVFAHVSDMY